MDSFIRLQLSTAIIVRRNLIHLLGFIQANHIHSVQKTEDGHLVLGNGTSVWTKRASDYMFIGLNDSIPDGVLTVGWFYQNRYELLDKIFTTNKDISREIYSLYYRLIKLMDIYQEPYSPNDTLFLYNHSSVHHIDKNGENHFVTHINNIPKYIPFDYLYEDKDIISVRAAISQLHDLKCCIDPSIDYELQHSLKLLQEEYPNEYHFDLKVQD